MLSPHDGPWSFGSDDTCVNVLVSSLEFFEGGEIVSSKARLEMLRALAVLSL